MASNWGFGHLVGGALLAAIGVVVSSLVRSQLAGVIGVFVWAIIIESLLFTERAATSYQVSVNLAMSHGSGHLVGHVSRDLANLRVAASRGPTETIGKLASLPEWPHR